MGCLHPEYRLVSGSISAVERIARKLPSVEEEDVPLMADKWKVYQGEDINEKMWKQKGKLRRIDHYWRDILQLKTSSGKDKYTRLEKVVIGVLALPHGNADVERGLSDNKKMLTKDELIYPKGQLLGIDSPRKL